MKIETKKFDTIEIEEDSIIEFPHGLIGFENCHRFALIKNEDFDPFCWLLSLEDEEFSLPILNPFLVNSDFDSMLARNLLAKELLECGFKNIFCVVNINAMKGNFTINLKSPIYVNFDEKKGRQLILDSEELLVDQPIW